MTPRSRQNKGKLVFDQSADHKLIPYIRKCGWIVITIKFDGKKIDDEIIIKKYAKQRYPICTRDKAMYTENKNLNKVGFLELELADKKSFLKYAKKVEKFMTGITAKKLHKCIWKIPLNKEPYKRMDI